MAQNTVKNPNLNGGNLPTGNNKGGNGNNSNNGNNGNNGNGGGNGSGGIGNDPLAHGGTFLYYYHPDHLGSTGYVTDEDAELYEHVEYFPFGETWISEAANSNQRVPYRYTSKELDEETGLYYYGARYYDPRTSVWQSVDPILGKYLPTGDSQQDENLPGMGGALNSLNLGLYTYSHINPIKYKDPDGNSTWIGENNNVQTVLNDNDLSIYKLSDGNVSKIGVTMFWDSFTTDGDENNASGHINIGVDMTSKVNEYANKAKDMNLYDVQQESKKGGDLDIKSSLPGVANKTGKAREGFLFNGKYVTLRDAGNILYGINTANKGIPKDRANKAAGGYAKDGSWGAFKGILGSDNGREGPYYGEDNITGTRIDAGHNMTWKDTIDDSDVAP